MTKAKAIENARYMVKRGKRCFIYRVASQWLISGNSEEETQAYYETRIFDYQEIKNENL